MFVCKKVMYYVGSLFLSPPPSAESLFRKNCHLSILVRTIYFELFSFLALEPEYEGKYAMETLESLKTDRMFIFLKGR